MGRGTSGKKTWRSIEKKVGKAGKGKLTTFKGAGSTGKKGAIELLIKGTDVAVK
jgi:hypothetical protein